MKTIDAIIIHCSATRAGQALRAKDIDRMHRARGFNQIITSLLTLTEWLRMGDR